MVDLPKVEQTFEASAAPYLAGIEAMIAANGRLIDSIGKVQAEIDALHGKTIEINLNEDEVLEQVAYIREVLQGIPDEKTIRINTVYGTEGGTGDAADAVNNLTDELNRQAAAWSRVENVGRDYSVMMGEVIADANETSGALDRIFAVSGAGVAELKSATEAVNDFDAGLQRIGNLGPELAASIKETGDAADALGVSIQDSLNAGFLKAVQVSNALAGGLKDVAPAAKDAEDAWTVLGNVSFTAVARMNSIGGIIHWIVAGGSELAATLIPAMIAFGAAAAVQLQAWNDVYNRMSAIYTSTEAVGKAYNTTAGQVLGLGDALQKAQNAAQPQVYELLGAAINGVNTSSGQFVSMGSSVTGILDQFAAKIDVDLKNGMTQFSGLISAGVQDLTEFGQILGNVGHALLNFASAMPGLAEVLLKIIDGISGVILWLSKLPPWIITTVMVIEELFRWGGLLVGVFAQIGSAMAGMGFLGLPIIGKIVTQFGEMFQNLALGAVGFVGNLGKMVTAIGGFVTGAENAGGALTSFDEDATAAITGASTGMIGLGVAAAAGFAALIMWAARSKTAMQQWTDGLVSAVNSAKGLQQVGQTYISLQQVTSALDASQAKLSSQMADSADKVPLYATRYSGEFIPAVNQTAQSIGVLSAAQKQLSTDFSTEIGNVDLIASKYKIGYVEAAELAGNAGANLTQTMKGNSTAAQVNLQMIENYVTGLGGMGAVQGALGGDINAVTFATALQDSKVQQLTQAWSTVMSTIQGPSNGFISIAQSLDQFNSDAAVTGARMTGLGGAATTTTRNVTDASTKLQGDFNNTVSAMQTYTNSLTTAAAITGNGGPMVQGIKDEIAILLPMAGSNANAAAQIKVLWQEAGGSASDSLGQIGTAVGNIKNPLQNLQTLTGNVSLSLANLGQDASNLAQTITSSLNQTLVSQAETLTGVSAKTATYLSDLQKYGPTSAITLAAQDALNSAQTQANQLSSEGAAGIDALTGKQAGQGDAAYTAAQQTQQLDTALKAIETTAPTTKTLLDAITTSVDNTGLYSQTTSGLLQTLQTQLSKTALGAQGAALMVDELIVALGKIPSQVSTSIEIQQQTIKTTVSAAAPANQSLPGGAPGKPGAASGWKVPGFGGGDTVPAMLEPGEAVVPKHLVSAVAPFLKAHGVPGFASGGVVGKASDLNAAYAALDALYANKTLTGVAWDNAYDAAWNRINADKAAGGKTTTTETSTAASAAAAKKAAAAVALRISQQNAIHKTMTAEMTAAIAQQHTQNVANRALAASQDAADFAKFAIPTVIPSPLAAPPEFMGGWLPSSLTGSGLTPTQYLSAPGAGGQSQQLEATHPANITVNMDGKAVWQSQQKVTLRYNLRNNGVPTGLQKPK